MPESRRPQRSSSTHSPSSGARGSAAGDGRDLRNDFVLEHRWIAERCARRFARRGEPLDDLMQVAHLGLVKAADGFDPSLGYSFASYAMPTVLGELRRHFRDRTWGMRVPRRSKDLITQMNAAIEVLYQRLQRMPAADEVADELGVDVEAVLETMEARSAYRPGSLNETGGGDDSGEGQARIDTVRDEDTELEDVADRMTTLAAVRALDPRTRRIVIWRFYEGCTQREIGERLGIGQVQVSRLLRSALAALRDALEGDAAAEEALERSLSGVVAAEPAPPSPRDDMVDLLLERHGTTYAEQVGIRIEKGTPAPLFQLLNLSVLMCAEPHPDVAVSATRQLIKAGWTTAHKMAGSAGDDRTKVLHESGCVHDCQQTSRLLGSAAHHVVDAYGGDLRRLRDEAEHDPARERVLLQRCDGLGDLGVDLFFREVQVTWHELMPFVDDRARQVAAALDLPDDSESLRGLVADDHRFAQLVTALVRVDVAGDVDDIRTMRSPEPTRGA